MFIFARHRVDRFVELRSLVTRTRSKNGVPELRRTSTTFCRSPMYIRMSPRASSPRVRTSRRRFPRLTKTRSSRRCVSHPRCDLSYEPPKLYYQILKKGELQVGEKEREHDLSSIRREIATLVAEKCVDPATQRRYPVGVIEKAMDDAGFSVRQGKNAKSQVWPPLAACSFGSSTDAVLQVSECLKLLQTGSKLPIQRARMRVSVSIPKGDADRLREQVLACAEKVERDEMGEEWVTVRTTHLLPLLLDQRFF